ncbi:MAG TPA: hypothetical protein VNY05_33590 [Candidatus Acidoferrales bacterium]|nr:hypothetical protein [Candidatus Acidoferrales bacterium]
MHDGTADLGEMATVTEVSGVAVPLDGDAIRVSGVCTVNAIAPDVDLIEIFCAGATCPSTAAKSNWLGKTTRVPVWALQTAANMKLRRMIEPGGIRPSANCVFSCESIMMCQDL